MTLSEVDTRAKLIDPALHKRGWTEDHIRREETAGTVEIVNGQGRRRARGKIDYVLRVKVAMDTQPIALALIEAKREGLPPGHGLTQAKGYAECRRLHVRFVFSEQAAAQKQQAAQWTQRLADLKKATPRAPAAIAKAEVQVKALTRAARDLAAKAKEIEDAVYDLKAVNPYRQPGVDERTPEQLLEIIEAKGQEITAALVVLRAIRTTEGN